jgi:CHAT domain-containing protein
MHGTYNVKHPRRSQLILAGRESIPEAERTISLGEALDDSVDLVGLRLLVLSACESSVFDIRHAPNEVLGLAAGFLQAGAAGVIASLWNVGDRPTYLLMSRFAELYLNPSTSLSPAQALAQAQRWLREEATNRVLQNYQPAFVDELSEAHKKRLLRLRMDAAALVQKEPDACMYADPKHWAAFVVTGR